MTKFRRSSLGTHFAGTGMYGPTEKEFDDAVIRRRIKVPRRGMLPTDRFSSDKKGKVAFEQYVKEQSGEVITYNLKENEHGTNE